MDQRAQIKPDTLNLIAEKHENTLELIGIIKDYLNQTLLAQKLNRQLITGTS